MTYGCKTEVWWLRPYDDPKTGKHFDFTWKATPNARSYGNGCPYLTGQRVWPGYNDLESNYPEVASQWHPTKNGTLLPSEITYASNKKYWWALSYDDPELGHFEFEWEAKAVNRTLLGEGCPFIGNDKVWLGYNDLSSRYPSIAEEWHPTKNRKRAPDNTVYVSTKKVWWECNKCGHEWYASVRGRTLNEIGCPKCRAMKKHYY